MGNLCYSTDKATMGKMLSSKRWRLSREQKKNRELYELRAKNKSIVGKDGV